jgi:hypothetical protein
MPRWPWKLPNFNGRYRWKIENRQKLFSPNRKYYWPSFDGFFVAVKNYSVPGVSHIPFQFFTSFKLKNHVYTYNYFNFSLVLNWKITYIHIIIYNNHARQSYTIISSIHKSHPLRLIHTHPSLILSIQVSYIDTE